METLNTKGIQVSVAASYEPKHSNPDELRFVFSYQVRVENMSEETVQLIGRHWFITDASLTVREVVGEGVIGQQPILKPGESHVYDSWSPISTEFGKMSGHYDMERVSDGSKFKANIPVFKLIASYVNN